MRTAGQFLQDTPNTDGQIFVPASRFSGIGALSNPSLGVIQAALTPSAANPLFAGVSTLLRTGQAPNYQEAFGTKAAVPGPSGVAGTSDPLGLKGMPPFLKANLPTLKGPVTGFIPKGIQINFIDVIYTILTNNATAASVGITATQYINNAAPATTALLAIAQNGLVLTAGATPKVVRVNLTNPTMITLTDTEIVVNLSFTPGAGGGSFNGVVLGVSFNYN